MAGLKPKQQDQQKGIKARFLQLKNYLLEIKQTVQLTQIFKKRNIQQQRHPKYINPTLQSQLVKRQKLRQQLAKLKKQISIKQNNNVVIQAQNGGQKVQKKLNKQSSLTISMFLSRISPRQSLQKLSILLAQQDWQIYKIYKNNQQLIFVNETTLKVYKLNYHQIAHDTLSIYENFIQFKGKLQKLQNTFIIRFLSKNDTENWFKLLSFSSQFILKNSNQRWSSTRLKKNKQKKLQKVEQKIEKEKGEVKDMKKSIQQKTAEQIKGTIIKKPFSKHNKILQKKNQQEIFPAPLPLLKLSLRKGSINVNQNQSSIFNLSNSSIIEKKVKITQDQLVQSIKFQVISQEDSKQRLTKKQQNLLKDTIQLQQTRKENHHQFNTKIQKKQSLYMTVKIVDKLEEKQKLLNESSLSKLGIHWHEDPEEKLSINHHLDSDSNSNNQKFSPKQTKQSSKKRSLSSKKKQSISKRDGGSQSPYIIKRVESATRDKSNSRDSSQIQLDTKYKRKTDFSLQLQKVQSLKGKRSNKNQIRDHYLNRLIQKQTIRQMSKSSSKGSSSKKQISNLLIPIPENTNKRPSQITVSRYGQQVIQQQQQLSIYQQTQTHQQKQSTQQQIRIQELKNGITLQKCSKNAWGIKQKRLYLSNTMNQLCYCDPQNQAEQKKIYIRDLRSIQYSRYAKGIIKHKKRFEQNRCLLIRIDKHGKQKLLQFYLNESEPVLILQEFTKKLQNFIQKVNQQGLSSQI